MRVTIQEIHEEDAYHPYREKLVGQAGTVIGKPALTAMESGGLYYYHALVELDHPVLIEGRWSDRHFFYAVRLERRV